MDQTGNSKLYSIVCMLILCIIRAPQQPACPEHMLKSITYIVGLTGSQSIYVNYITCRRIFCTIIFENITRNVDDREHNLTLVLTDTHSSNGSQIMDSYETVKYICEFQFEGIFVYMHTLQLIAVTTTSL